MLAIARRGVGLYTAISVPIRIQTAIWEKMFPKFCVYMSSSRLPTPSRSPAASITAGCQNAVFHFVVPPVLHGKRPPTPPEAVWCALRRPSGYAKNKCANVWLHRRNASPGSGLSMPRRIAYFSPQSKAWEQRARRATRDKRLSSRLPRLCLRGELLSGWILRPSAGGVGVRTSGIRPESLAAGGIRCKGCLGAGASMDGRFTECSGSPILSSHRKPAAKLCLFRSARTQRAAEFH